MILFDLNCDEGHRFEAWFRNGASFDEQAAAGAIVCPSCGGTQVSKAPMAPHITRATRRSESSAPEQGHDNSADSPPATPESVARRVRGELEALRRHVETSCDYVGSEFAEEARRIHYGEAGPRNIYGETSERQAQEMESEGIEFRRIPWPSRGN